MLNNIKKLFCNKKAEEKTKKEPSVYSEFEDNLFMNRALGSLYGLYIGDALGAPLEFQHLKGNEGLSNYGTGGVHDVKRGEWTDDTSMTLALIDSINTNGFDLRDQADKYTEWFKKGKYSSRDYCFDIGVTVTMSLNEYKNTQNPESGQREYNTSGNGSLMRLAPVPLFYYKDGLDQMVNYSVLSSKTTHQSDLVINSIKYFTIIFDKILSGEKDKDKIITVSNDELEKYGINDHTFLSLMKDNKFLETSYRDLETDGFVVYSLIVAIWSFYHTDNFKDALLKAVNLGGDSDTNGAITGQLVGAYYGFNNIPKDLLDGLYKKEILDEYTIPFLQKLKEKINK